jgi:hypothetical protein
VNNSRNSIAAAKDHIVPVPAIVPNDMIIAVQPSANSQDDFWVAMVQSVRSDQPLVYNIRYFNYNKSKKAWVLMKGTGAYGWVPHTAIIAAGIEFNTNNSMKASSIKLISDAIVHD